MNKIKFNKLLPMLMLLLLGGWLGSCVDDNDPRADMGGKEKMMSFSIRVPSSGTPKTYALTEAEENEVKSIVILLFDGIAGTALFEYQPIYVNRITTDPGDNAIKTFTAKIPEGSYSMVVLANSTNIVGNVLSTINVGDTKQSVMDKLKLTLPANTKWNSDPSSGSYVAIPMWGETPVLTVNSSLATTNLTLTRMLAKIDVSLATTAQAKFQLKSVRLYNYNNQGQVAPNPANWTAGIATAPSVPTGTVKPTPQGNAPHLYDNAAITTTDISSKGEIYTFESDVAGVADLKDKTCLVIGGSYDGGTETFYRVDFARTVSGTSTYLNLLRNHQYNVIINEVSAPGLGSAIDAFNSVPVNIRASVVAWSDGHFTDFAVNDQYILGVSQSVFDFTREARTAADDDNTLSIITDYLPVGWKITKIDDGAGNATPWLTTVGGIVSGNSVTGDDIQLELTENTSGAPRTAYIYVTADADRLVYKVKVTQDVITKISIDITDATNKVITELVFPSEVGAIPAAQSFTLDWSPKENSLFFSSASGSNAFTFESGSDIIPSGGGSLSDPLGAKTYNIQPTAVTATDLLSDPLFERRSVVVYTISDGLKTENKTLILRQLVYNLTANPNSKYMIQTGKTYRFNVKSNSTWRIKSVDETILSGTSATLLNLQASDNLQALTTTGGINNTLTDTEITFTTASTSTANGISEVTVVFESTLGSFSDVTIKFKLMAEYYPATPHQGWAGSNIYWDGTKMTFDDVNVKTRQTYQGLIFKFGSLWGISPLSGAYSTATTLYRPSGGRTSGIAWTSILSASGGTTSINPPTGKSVRDRGFLYEITDETTGFGDICAHLTEKGWAPGSTAGKKWRMPTSREFEAVANYTKSGTFGIVPSTSATGSFSITAGYTKTGTVGTPFFPASGLRLAATGELNHEHHGGQYWSSSPNSANAYHLAFGPTELIPANTYPRANGYTVRCVVQED